MSDIKLTPAMIEVTPDMIKAGASVLYGFDTLTRSEASWAEDVFLAMLKAQTNAKLGQRSRS